MLKSAANEKQSEMEMAQKNGYSILKDFQFIRSCSATRLSLAPIANQTGSYLWSSLGPLPLSLVTPHFGFTLNPSSQQMSKKVTPRLWPLSPLISVALLERTCLALIAFRCCCGRVRLLCVTPSSFLLPGKNGIISGVTRPLSTSLAHFFLLLPALLLGKAKSK